MKFKPANFDGPAALNLLVGCALLALIGPGAYAQQTTGTPALPAPQRLSTENKCRRPIRHSAV